MLAGVREKIFVVLFTSLLMSNISFRGVGIFALLSAALAHKFCPH